MDNLNEKCYGIIAKALLLLYNEFTMKKHRLLLHIAVKELLFFLLILMIKCMISLRQWQGLKTMDMVMDEGDRLYFVG